MLSEVTAIFQCLLEVDDQFPLDALDDFPYLLELLGLFLSLLVVLQDLLLNNVDFVSQFIVLLLVWQQGV